MRNANYYITKHLSSNIVIYLVCIFFFVFGICLGALSVNNVNLDVKDDIASYVNGFLRIISNESFDTTLVLKQSIKLNLYSVIIIYLSGLTFLGLFLIPTYLIFRGYCFGFTIGFLAQCMGKEGFILSLSTILPQSIIYIPIIIVLTVLGINYSISKLRERHSRKYDNNKASFTSYTLSASFSFFILIGGSFIESFITPALIKIISPYIL